MTYGQPAESACRSLLQANGCYLHVSHDANSEKKNEKLDDFRVCCNCSVVHDRWQCSGAMRLWRRLLRWFGDQHWLQQLCSTIFIQHWLQQLCSAALIRVAAYGLSPCWTLRLPSDRSLSPPQPLARAAGALRLSPWLAPSRSIPPLRIAFMATPQQPRLPSRENYSR